MNIQEQIKILRELATIPNVVDEPIRKMHCGNAADTMEAMLKRQELTDKVVQAAKEFMDIINGGFNTGGRLAIAQDNLVEALDNLE